MKDTVQGLAKRDGDRLFCLTRGIICQTADYTNESWYYYDDAGGGFDEKNIMNIEFEDYVFDKTEMADSGRRWKELNLGCLSGECVRRRKYDEVSHVWMEMEKVESQLLEYWRRYRNGKCLAKMTMRVLCEQWLLIELTRSKEMLGVLTKEKSDDIRKALMHSIIEIFFSFKGIIRPEGYEKINFIYQMIKDGIPYKYGVDPIYNLYLETAHLDDLLTDISRMEMDTTMPLKRKKEIIDIFDSYTEPREYDIEIMDVDFYEHNYLYNIIKKFEKKLDSYKCKYDEIVNKLGGKDISIPGMMLHYSMIMLNKIKNNEGDPLLNSEEVTTILFGFYDIVLHRKEVVEPSCKINLSPDEKGAVMYTIFKMYCIYREFLKATQHRNELCSMIMEEKAMIEKNYSEFINKLFGMNADAVKNIPNLSRYKDVYANYKVYPLEYNLADFKYEYDSWDISMGSVLVEANKAKAYLENKEQDS